MHARGRAAAYIVRVVRPGFCCWSAAHVVSTNAWRANCWSATYVVRTPHFRFCGWATAHVVAVKGWGASCRPATNIVWTPNRRGCSRSAAHVIAANGAGGIFLLFGAAVGGNVALLRLGKKASAGRSAAGCETNSQQAEAKVSGRASHLGIVLRDLWRSARVNKLELFRLRIALMDSLRSGWAANPSAVIASIYSQRTYCTLRSFG